MVYISLITIIPHQRPAFFIFGLYSVYNFIYYGEKRGGEMVSLFPQGDFSCWEKINHSSVKTNYNQNLFYSREESFFFFLPKKYCLLFIH